MATPWTTAVSDTRTLLKDGETNKLRYRKSVLGRTDGVNKVFKTFEDNRSTDFSTATAPAGVYVDGLAVPVMDDNTQFGEFTLASAVLDGQTLEATYYYQWWRDEELETFLKNAMQWLGFGDDFTQIADGLQPAAMHFAAQEACHSAAMRWSERWSETYQMQDSPSKENKGPVEQFLKLAKEYREKANELRKNFYERNDQAGAPLFGVAVGRFREITPQS